MPVDLPWKLRDAIDRRTETVAPSALARVAAELRERYRSDGGRQSPLAYARPAAIAYAAVRLPATFAATVAALRQVQLERPDWEPRTLLDLGAGPGGSAWAACEVWESLERVVAVEAASEMISLGRDLADNAAHPALRSSSWIHADLTASSPLTPSDLVIVSYVLGEVDAAARDKIIDRAWEATIGTLVIAEPGTPAGFERIKCARSRLISTGGFVTAPCPHDAACPMNRDDWCHFAVRLPRTRTHRVLKDAELGYEDEKFSYVAVSRVRTSRAPARVLRHPTLRPGRIQLELCTSDGLASAIVSKRDRDAFRRARKTGWGERFLASDTEQSDEPALPR